MQIGLSRESDSWQYFCILYGDRWQFLADATSEGGLGEGGMLCLEPWLSLQGRSIQGTPSSESVLLTSLLYCIRTFARFRLEKMKFVLLLIFYSCCEVITVVAEGPIVPTSDDSSMHIEHRRNNNWQWKLDVLGKQPVLVPRCTPQILRELAWGRIRTFTLARIQCHSTVRLLLVHWKLNLVACDVSGML